MWGGGGADTFVFETIADSGFGAQADLIRDFRRDSDLIDLEALNIAAFVGTAAFSGTRAEVRYRALPGNVALVLIDNDGDGVQDASIKVFGVSALGAADFLL